MATTTTPISSLSDIPTSHPIDPIRAEREIEAANCIKRAWRRSRVGFDILGADSMKLMDLSHTEYRQLCKRSLQPNFKRGTKNSKRTASMRREIVRFQKARKIFQCQKEVVCTSFDKRGLPVCKLMKKIPKFCTRIGGIHVKKEALAARHKFKPKTKEDLDRIVCALRKAEDIASWAHLQDGCYARARFVINYLLLCGVPLRDLAKQYVCIPQKSPASKFKWLYHVAALIKLDDGSSWVLDPSLCPTSALSVEKWIEKQKTDPNSRLGVQDRGYIPPNGKGSLTMRFFDQLGMTFATYPFSRACGLSSDDKTFKLEFTEIDDETDFFWLSAIRCEFEETWLRV